MFNDYEIQFILKDKIRKHERYIQELSYIQKMKREARQKKKHMLRNADQQPCCLACC
ncbi:hypothetical protein [Peribacillus glennii]|uniref:hypothetical protein n=1 Tax=Peribacillus glennii TaxID=2303991 RepID=UPI0018F1E697|nr:hypothetical protein [Peribacillus glennii]